uniref:ATP synthase lipid-binding protein, mitochondrial n=1 Tax=Callithrix jacchus TaxID=9483 RepID=A0A8I3XA06_CALJA
MFACAKLACTPALIRAGSRVAYRPISASVLSRPETRNGEGSTVFNGAQNGVSQLIQREFQTSAISRDIDTAAKFIGAGAATVGRTEILTILNFPIHMPGMSPFI